LKGVSNFFPNVRQMVHSWKALTFREEFSSQNLYLSKVAVISRITGIEFNFLGFFQFNLIVDTVILQFEKRGNIVSFQTDVGSNYLSEFLFSIRRPFNAIKKVCW